jgi:hypothetical protein
VACTGGSEALRHVITDFRSATTRQQIDSNAPSILENAQEKIKYGIGTVSGSFSSIAGHVLDD